MVTIAKHASIPDRPSLGLALLARSSPAVDAFSRRTQIGGDYELLPLLPK